MTVFKTATLAAVLTATALTGAPAFAKGGGGDIAQQREKLFEEIRAARAADGSDCRTASLWEMMFGNDEEAVAETAPAAAQN